MATLKIHNWDKWQSYRKDRGQPPWIKVHREVMRNMEWMDLNDAQRGQLVQIWLLAADKDGQISDDPKKIKRVCFMTSEPDLNLFIKLGFIDSDANTAPERRQDGVTMTNQRRDREETETEAEKTPPRRDVVEADFWKSLKANPAYAHIHFENELGKMKAWIDSHPGRRLTKRFALNWLNKVEAPLSLTIAKPRQETCASPGCSKIWVIRRDGRAYCDTHRPDAVPVQNSPPKIPTPIFQGMK